MKSSSRVHCQSIAVTSDKILSGAVERRLKGGTKSGRGRGVLLGVKIKMKLLSCNSTALMYGNGQNARSLSFSSNRLFTALVDLYSLLFRFQVSHLGVQSFPWLAGHIHGRPPGNLEWGRNYRHRPQKSREPATTREAVQWGRNYRHRTRKSHRMSFQTMGSQVM